MKKIIFILAAALMLPALGSTFGQTTGVYDFLRLDMSARAGALGGTFVANSDDPDVIFYNPAGIKLLEKTPISFSYVKHLVGINLASLAVSADWKGIGRIAGAVKYVNYGTFTAADEYGNKTGEYGAGEVAFILGYANNLDKNFYYGSNVKFIYSKIADRYSTAAALDLGLHYAVPEDQLDFGFSILNIGSQLVSYYDTKENLPLDMVIGVSKKMQHLPLRLSLDFHNLNEKQNSFFAVFGNFSIGAEFDLSKALRLRFGYNNQRRKNLTIGSFAGLAGFNIGLGALISSYRFDYGYSSLGLIGSINRISVSTSL